MKIIIIIRIKIRIVIIHISGPVTEVRINGSLVNRVFHLLINGVYGVTTYSPLILIANDYNNKRTFAVCPYVHGYVLASNDLNENP